MVQTGIRDGWHRPGRRGVGAAALLLAAGLCLGASIARADPPGPPLPPLPEPTEATVIALASDLPDGDSDVTVSQDSRTDGDGAVADGTALAALAPTRDPATDSTGGPATPPDGTVARVPGGTRPGGAAGLIAPGSAGPQDDAAEGGAGAEATGETETAAAPVRPRPRPFLANRPDMRCTADGSHCISLGNYIPDVCRTIEATATEAGLDVDFFARLVWKESLYDARAVSPVGAQGIAQFMPFTAQLRGLDDPFNPAKALRASAVYLAELRDFYGNIGLAAAAYNAGEARVDDFVVKRRGLPLETRDYVHAITGYSGEAWRDSPPKEVDLRLAKDKEFRAACETLASSRSISEFRKPGSVGSSGGGSGATRPWGVILAAHSSRDGVQRKYAALTRANPVLRNKKVDYVRMSLPSRSAGRQYIAQIGAGSRKEADTLCWKLRKSGIGCFVLRN